MIDYQKSLLKQFHSALATERRSSKMLSVAMSEAKRKIYKANPRSKIDTVACLKHGMTHSAGFEGIAGNESYSCVRWLR